MLNSQLWEIRKEVGWIEKGFRSLTTQAEKEQAHHHLKELKVTEVALEEEIWDPTAATTSPASAATDTGQPSD